MKQPFDTAGIEKDLYQCLIACNQFMAHNHGDGEKCLGADRDHDEVETKLCSRCAA